MKVICAGAPKTGTKSFARALRILGYDSVYDIPEAVEFGFEQWEDIWERRQSDFNVLFDTVYLKVDAVVDMPHCYFFDAFLKRWPDAKVVLLLRDEDAWFASFKNMVDRAAKDYSKIGYIAPFCRSMKRMLRFFQYIMNECFSGNIPHPLLWKCWYRRHNAYVRSVVPKSQLLEYRVTEGWDPLCKFLGKPVPEQKFPFENKATDKHTAADMMMQDTWIAKKAAREIKIMILSITFFSVLLAYLCLC